jgi:SET domain-containing protein
MNLIEIKQSKIHGKGIFTKEEIKKNKRLGVGIKYKYFLPKITENFGTMINHSYFPNCRLQYLKNSYYIIANKNINRGTEITINYNKTPWFIANAEKYYK